MIKNNSFHRSEKEIETHIAMMATSRVISFVFYNAHYSLYINFTMIVKIFFRSLNTRFMDMYCASTMVLYNIRAPSAEANQGNRKRMLCRTRTEYLLPLRLPLAVAELLRSEVPRYCDDQ